MARKSDTYRSNNPSKNAGRGKLRRLLASFEKEGKEISIPEINKAMGRTVIEENQE